VGYAVVGISSNAVNWTTYPLPTRVETRGIAAGPRSFFVVGLNGMILESAPFRQPTIGFQRNSATAWTLTAEMEPWFPHIIEYSSDLQKWQPGEAVTSTNGHYSQTVLASNAPARFYRVKSP
jgi:hypothetical protein